MMQFLLSNQYFHHAEKKRASETGNFPIKYRYIFILIVISLLCEVIFFSNFIILV